MYNDVTLFGLLFTDISTSALHQVSAFTRSCIELARPLLVYQQLCLDKANGEQSDSATETTASIKIHGRLPKNANPDYGSSDCERDLTTSMERLASPVKILHGEYGRMTGIKRLRGPYRSKEACNGFTNIAITTCKPS
jgi:hypothetical protein